MQNWQRVSSPKKRATIGSPLKSSSPSKVNGPGAEEYQNIQSTDQLQFQIGERDVEIERMKITLIALNEKLAIVNDIKLDGDQFKEYFQNTENQRGSLQVKIVETSQKVVVDTNAHSEKHEQDVKVIESLQVEIQNLKVHISNRENDHFKALEKQSQQHHNEIQERILQYQNLEQKYTQELSKQQNQHLDAIKQMQNEHAKILKERDDQHITELKFLDQQKTKRELEYLSQTRANQEKHDLELQKLTAEMRAQQDKANQILQKTLADHNKELRIFREEQERSDADHKRNIESMRAEHATSLRNQQYEHERVNRELESKHSREIQERIEILLKKEQQFTFDLEQLRKQKDEQYQKLYLQFEEKRSIYEIEINRLKIVIERLETVVLEKKSIILSLEQLLIKKKDVEDQLQEALNREKDNQAARDTLQKELENATDYILELEEKVYKANKTSLELLKQLKDSEVEIETLKQYIIDLKQRIAVYIPVRDDQIDKRLAEFINNYPERQKLKIMFMRETEGVYQFGTKRVMVKVEKDAIKIRVGGGFLSIDEFLDQYTPVELEKLERKDPLKRLSEKIAIQKTIVNAAVREQSPIRQSPSPPRGKTAV